MQNSVCKLHLYFDKKMLPCSWDSSSTTVTRLRTGRLRICSCIPEISCSNRPDALSGPTSLLFNCNPALFLRNTVAEW